MQMSLNQKSMIILSLILDKGKIFLLISLHFYFLIFFWNQKYSAKGDIFGRDIQILGDIKSRQKALGIWQDRSTRNVKAKDDQVADPRFE